MVKGKLILICQSGGDFVTNDDGTLSYNGGEANAVNISHETLFDDLKLKLGEMCNLELTSVSIKYFLPGNRRILISLKSDKDLKRMMEYHGNSVTADLFITGKEGFDRSVLKVNPCREDGLKLAETVNQVATPSTAADSVSLHSVPITVVATAPNSAGPSALATNATIRTPSQETTPSMPSSDHGADEDSDYAPRSIVAGDAVIDSPIVFDTGGTPADTVKKRRRISWQQNGGHGPTGTELPGGARSRKKKRKDASIVMMEDDMEEKGVTVPITYDVDIAICDGDLPEKLVASWKGGITGVGQDFKSVREFREALQKYAIAHRFVYKLKKNDTNRASGRCVSEGCSWRIHASWVPSAHSFRIKKFNGSHTCGGESWKAVHPAKNWLVSIIKDRLKDSPHHKPKEIANGIMRDFGISLSYTQVWRGMEDAREQLQGSYKESYNQLPWFCEKAVEQNPGSVVQFVTDDDKKFRSLFVAFRASILGFQNGCRPLIFLEVTSLKSKYQEMLLTATAVDADDGFFPVAFAIVDVESDNNWHWFLRQLKDAISTSRSITFISDREKTLKNHILEVFENAYHGYSIFHLMESFKRSLRGPFNGDGRGVLPGLFLAAAHALRLGDFQKFTDQIRQISSAAYDWVIQVEPECWTSLLFKGQYYNYIVENVAELYIKLMEEVRESTIMQKLESLSCMISTLINNRRTDLNGWSTKLSPLKENKILEESRKAHNLRVLCSSDTLFEVHDDLTHVVNIENWDCTCLEWKQSGLPCRHAIAVFSSKGKSVYDYCSVHFFSESYQATYCESINPIPGVGRPIEKEEVESSAASVLPPCPPRGSSQEKKEQSKLEDLNRRTVTCSRCKEPGHNKASCKAVL